MSTTPDASDFPEFVRDGFFGPVPLFTSAQCELIINHFCSGNLPSPVGWNKGAAASDPLLYNFATTPVLVSYLRTLLGDNILLWGASLVVREPGHVHPWHCDIESSDPGGGFVSVWIGIENTSRESALQLIAGSHRIGKTIQQVAHERGLRRGKPSAGGVLYWAREIQPDAWFASAERVLQWAREIHPDARFIQPAMNDGDALFFDGRVWHGSDNSRIQGARKALLFQYAAAGTPVKMVDLAHVEWPFQFKRTRVPVLVVTGSDESGANKIVPRPTPDEGPRLARRGASIEPVLRRRSGRTLATTLPFRRLNSESFAHGRPRIGTQFPSFTAQTPCPCRRRIVDCSGRRSRARDPGYRRFCNAATGAPAPWLFRLLLCLSVPHHSQSYVSTDPVFDVQMDRIADCYGEAVTDNGH